MSEMKVWRQCQALDQKGNMCGERHQLRVVMYHGDGEIYGHGSPEDRWPCWVRVTLCPEHRTLDWLGRSVPAGGVPKGAK